MTVDLQPDEIEALQAEDGPVPAAEVCIRTPVRVQLLPRKSAAVRTRTIGTAPVRVLSDSPMRASATVMASAAIQFAFNFNAANDASTMAAWPANVPYTLTATSELWISAAAGTATVSVISEFWANGPEA